MVNRLAQHWAGKTALSANNFLLSHSFRHLPSGRFLQISSNTTKFAVKHRNRQLFAKLLRRITSPKTCSYECVPPCFRLSYECTCQFPVYKWTCRHYLYPWSRLTTGLHQNDRLEKLLRSVRSFCQEVEALPTYSHHRKEIPSFVFSVCSGLDQMIRRKGSFLKYTTLRPLSYDLKTPQCSIVASYPHV